MRWPVAALLVVLAAAGCVTRTGGAASSEDPTGSRETTPRETGSAEACEYREAEGEPAPVGLPPERETERAESAVLSTTAGELSLELTPDEAQCTVRSFAFLVREGFYDGTRCHRMTTSPTLKVLQCGDPDGDGGGGPGYTIPDENPTDLESTDGPSDPQTGEPPAIYPRGTLAMANTGQPDSGGSQFFLVYGDSTLPPNYAVFGTVDEAGLQVLDRIAAGGISPVPNPQTGQTDPADGSPVMTVEISAASVG